MIQTYLFVPQIILKDLSDPVRSHRDLDNDTTPYFIKKLAKQLVSQGHVLDLFASSLDQVCCDFPTDTCIKCIDFTNLMFGFKFGPCEVTKEN